VGILLYRKHVITEQPYIAQLIETMEQYGLRPLPIFINGVEAHTVASAGGSSKLSCCAASAPLCDCLLPY
jgi:cobalamin biosynthesis Mg chelatase CobN